ncbi:MAG TPA: class I SAM-dependent methyltransferase [Bacteroidales bacterium]|jgi:predicted O-methyltransferase YrrM|nr:class I SAM-dependent methyltransferase [Bacteroidales bacterium]
MNKITKAISAIRNIISKPYLLNLVLDDNEVRKRAVSGKYNGLECFPQLPLNQVTGTSAMTINPFAFGDGGSLPTDLALLKALAARFPRCSYFEIGTWRGESVANVASIAHECFTMDLPDAEKRILGYDDEYISQHAVLSKHLPNVTHLKANSRSFDFSSLNRKFDLVFIDGDHHYESVLNDTQKIFKHLVHDNSIVVWHDYAFNPEKVRYEVMAAILDGCQPEFHGHLYHVGNTMCAVYWKNAIALRTQEPQIFEVTLKIL